MQVLSPQPLGAIHEGGGSEHINEDGQGYATPLSLRERGRDKRGGEVKAMDIPFVRIRNNIIATKDISAIRQINIEKNFIIQLYLFSDNGKSWEIIFDSEEERDKEFKYLCSRLCKTFEPYPPVETRKNF